MEEYKGMKVGDIITAYQKGFHRLTKIEDRSHLEHKPSPLFTYERVADSSGKPTKSKVDACDSSFCKPALEYIDDMISDLEVTRKYITSMKITSGISTDGKTVITK